MSHVAFEATHQWMVWVALFYMNIVYSLLSLPFIALALPLISTILTQVRFIISPPDSRSHISSLPPPPPPFPLTPSLLSLPSPLTSLPF